MKPWLKVPLLWVMKGSYFGFGSPQQQVDMHSSSKKHFHILIICISFYLICSTTPKRFVQRFIFPNPSCAWRWSAVIGRFHLKQDLWAFNAPKAAPSGKEWICMFIQTNAKIKFSQVCASTPECTLDDGAGRHVSLRPPPISMVYNTAELIGPLHEHSFIYVFMNDLRCLAVLQKY